MTKKQRSGVVGIGLATFGGAAAIWLGGAEARPAQSRLATTVVEHPALAQLDARFADATPGSAAQFRVREESDRVVLRLTGQLDYLGAVVANATPGSPAQFRALEEAESLREQLRSVARD